MTIQEITKAYNRIIGRLDSKELKNAFDDLQGLMAGTNQYAFQDKLNELQDTYKYMLRYRMDGVQDPMQRQIYQQIQSSAYELADTLKQKALAVDSPLSFYSRRRAFKMQPSVSFKQIHQILSKNRDIELLSGDITAKKQLEAEVLVLFNKIWLSGFLTTEEKIDIQDILHDRELPYSVGCQIVSALLLGLEEAFDKEKMLLLFDAAENPEQEVSARAFVALLIILYKYRKRTELYPQIGNRLNALAETNPAFPRIVQTITLRFILARETEKISRKLQDEILPEMMKLDPIIGKKLNLKDLTPDALSNEMNPEWQDALFSNKELNQKMAEFSELQMEGADVLHSTFVHLKNYPFFREVGNWFLPFSLSSLIDGEEDSQFNSTWQLIDAMTQASYMCNSDKYSLFFSMKQFAKEARGLVEQQVNHELAEYVQQNKEELIGNRPALELIVGEYVQDLYRFHKLYPSHLDFDDIFIYPLDFHNLPVLKPFISDAESLTAIAEYYLRKNYFQDALVIYRRLLDEHSENDVLYQKSGYCRQMSGDIEGALKDYLHADLLNPQSKWVIRRIAGCYRTLKQPEKALEYYHRYEALSPKNLSVQISIGHCHLELKNYSEALKYFFKVDYLDTESHKAWRPIAWCSFLTDKYDQARNYYKKILDHQPTMQDYLNAGHTEWVLQNMNAALEYYRKAVREEKGDWSKFYEQFEQDVPDLKNAGVEEEEIPLVLDELRYRL